MIERGYSVAEVSERPGISSHSRYKWVKEIKPDNAEQQAPELIETKSKIPKLRASCAVPKRSAISKKARHFTQ